MALEVFSLQSNRRETMVSPIALPIASPIHLNIEMTQGSYWKGAQIPFWLYKWTVILPFTGLFGIDHLLLRSPITAILKALSIIPLFGFWYFYDMAQLGEKDLIQKHGIGVPFYGPTGIGAGIFKGKGQPDSPPTMARPWRYMGYVMTSLLFIAFPINKLVLGDYWGALAQTVMYFGPLVFMAIGWGFYDTYRILFDSKKLLEKGPSRIPPASWIIDGNFNRSHLGPSPAEPHDPSKDGWFRRFMNAAAEVPITTLKAATGIVQVADAATIGVVREVAKVATDSATKTIKTTTNAAQEIVAGTAGIASNTVKAAQGTAHLLSTLPGAVEKITTGLADPEKLLAAATVAQTGGGINSMMPSSVSTLLIVGVAFLAFGGYTMYTLRSITRPSSDNDDSPPEPVTVRGTSGVYSS